MSSALAFHQAMTPGSSGSAVFRPPSRSGAAKLAERYTRRPYGRHRSASAATFSEVVRREDEHVGVDAVDDGAVDADRRVRARVVHVAGAQRSRKLVPLPERSARVAALDRAVHVVPVIEHPQLHLRPLRDVESIDRLPRLHQAQEVVGAVQRADLAVGGDRDDGTIADSCRANDDSPPARPWRDPPPSPDPGSPRSSSASRPRAPPRQRLAARPESPRPALPPFLLPARRE